MSSPEHAAARQRERNDALDNWLAENCKQCLLLRTCGLHADILADYFCDGLLRAWELPLIGNVPCSLKVERASCATAENGVE